MKKILTAFLFSLFVITISAQENYTDIYRDIEKAETLLDLSKDQIAKIKKLNREYAEKFRAIGKNRTISGYEKGQRKRALAMQKREDIDKILNKSQIDKWNSKYDKEDFDDIISDKYDDILDRLENKYDNLIEKVEDDDRLSKSEKKAKIKELKNKYKAEKEHLKEKERRVKNRY